MALQKKLQINNRVNWLKSLDALSKVSDSAIISIKDNVLSSLVTSEDNTLILYTEFTDLECEHNVNLNVPDLKKLNRVLDTLNTQEIELIINSNNLEYKGHALKFKYHLFEDGFLTKSQIKIDKILAFKHDISFSITKEVLQTLIRYSAYATETNKIYLFTENGSLKAELSDRARHNTDSISLTLGEVDFELDPLPINFDNIKLLTTNSNVFTFGINKEYGVTVIDIASDDIKLKYILTSLTQ